ncbi:hypothetical protein [Carnobacterium maltaromaticum]|uniref:hypothetical protein n=1 Tax=Carnobacterium maltaromaticum TaxID=2751 RepID=UPI00191BA9F2|nr:hypothetical protein [Carnobacterium maltaromaticum]CAD5903100.1 hypothetical protein CMALT394_630022 [Carnobacterium maltaromaticum]
MKKKYSENNNQAVENSKLNKWVLIVLLLLSILVGMFYLVAYWSELDKEEFDVKNSETVG